MTADPQTSPASAAARQHSLRERNLELVARAVFEASAPLSRADVAGATGLARATVSTLVDRLVAGGLLDELDPVSSHRAGRPAVPLVPAARSIVGMGIEVNVDYLGAIIMDLTGQVIDERVEPGSFHGADPAVVLGRAGELARSLAMSAVSEGMRVAGARLALPGIVDARTGLLQIAPNLGWSALDPVPLLGLGDAFGGSGAGLDGRAGVAGGSDGRAGVAGGAGLGGIRVEVANEAKLAGLAELSGDFASSFLYVSADVGIGAALIVERELFLGEHGWNGEIGHVLVDPSGSRCGCGSHGCLEQYAGTEAINRAAGLPLASPVEALVRAASEGSVPVLTALERAGVALGSALADFVNLVDIGTIVLGGAYTELFEWLRPFVEDTLADRVLAAPYVPLEVRPAIAGPFAAMAGGAREVLRDVLSAPAEWV